MDGPGGCGDLGFSRAGRWSIGRFQIDRRSFPEQVLLVGPGPGDGESGPGLVHEPLGSAGADLGVPAERGIHRAGQYFHNLVFVGVGVGRVLLSDGAPPSSVLPGPSRGWEARGCRGGGLGPVPGWTSSGESGVPDLAVPGTGVMEVGGVSIAPVRRFVLGHA